MTQVQPKQDTTVIDVRADQMLALYHQQKRDDQKRREVAQSSLDQQAIAVLQTLIATEFEPELLSALPLEFVVRHEGHNLGPEVILHYAKVRWHISQNFSHRSPKEWRWSISATRYDNSYGYQESGLSGEAEPHALQTFLLLKFGERREQLRKKAEEAAQKEKQQRLIEGQRKAEQEQEERLRSERIAQADAMDASLRKELQALQQQKLESLWRWPTGMRLTIYHLTFPTPKFLDENGETIAETDGGWTAVDHLDEEGYVRLEPFKTSSWSSPCAPREIKLDMASHRPIWERKTFGSIEELPETLKQHVRVHIDHVVMYYDEDGKSRLTKVEQYGYEDSGPYAESVGYVPLPWIQALVNQLPPMGEQ